MTDYRCDHGNMGHCPHCKFEFEMKQDKAAILKRKKTLANKVVEVPGLFLELQGKVSLVDTSSGKTIKTVLEKEFVLNAVLKAVQEAITVAIKKEKK